MDTRIHIFTGHFGSGKTEVALNFAEKCAETRKTSVIDMDTVNPYFRSAEQKEQLNQRGIEVICSEFAASNVDIPILTARINKVFYDTQLVGIFDVGGDEDGAYALGVYKKFFDECGYKMHLVVNTCRPLTASCEDITELMEKIETASRLKITDIVNNTNIGMNTDYRLLMSGKDIIDEVCRKKNINIFFHSCAKTLISDDGSLFRMDIHMKKPWEFN